jgi:hypothetical protein
MCINQTTLIQGDNLSSAWAKAVSACYDATGASLSPVVVEFPVSAESELEIDFVRSTAERYVKTLTPKLLGVESVSNTIFPQSLWERCGNDRQALYEKYVRCLPIIKRTPANRRGVYFERMIAYSKSETETINQVEQIISTWREHNNHRHAAHQIGIFDPRKDHSHSRILGFPCLQQVAFHATGRNGENGLEVTGFYATQTLLEKGYGNYLGLYRLGQFIAQAMNLSLSKIVCFSSVLKLSNDKPKSICSADINKLMAV